MEKEKTYYFMVYSLYKAQKLTKAGFPIMRLGKNKNIEGQLVFFFLDTPEVREAFSKI